MSFSNFSLHSEGAPAKSWQQGVVKAGGGNAVEPGGGYVNATDVHRLLVEISPKRKRHDEMKRASDGESRCNPVVYIPASTLLLYYSVMTELATARTAIHQILSLAPEMIIIIRLPVKDDEDEAPAESSANL
ncbi:hypothetical protein DFH09DRAFT_1079310 [Mycena vulgaris]|nr:hypothetical protein DFH09DRAFT_1079310 [Mycena vulgaris]